jgi:hypothetical protein
MHGAKVKIVAATVGRNIIEIVEVHCRFTRLQYS